MWDRLYPLLRAATRKDLPPRRHGERQTRVATSRYSPAKVEAPKPKPETARFADKKFWGVMAVLGAANSVTVNAVTYAAPSGTVETANPSSNMGFTGNGTVDSGSATFGTSAFTNNGIQAVVAKSGTSLSYATTSTLASTGCTTTPQYVIYAKAIF